MKIFTFAGLMVVLALLNVAAYAQLPNLVVSIDENGNGLATVDSVPAGPFQGFMAPDPFPGGLPSVLTYQSFSTWVAGDVLVYELSAPTVLSDILRFGANGDLLVYSDNSHGVDSLADVGFPSIIQPFPYAIVYEADGWVDYTPTPGLPGYATGVPYNISYHFVSDSAPAVPELPAPLLASVASLGGLLWRRRK